MTTSSKIDNEALIAASERIGGLLSCQPSADFIGLNFHYLPPLARVAFLRSLAGTTTDNKFDRKTRYNINWQNNSYMKKTAKRYLFSNVRTSFLNITADEMAIAIFLPVARFKKGSPY